MKTSTKIDMQVGTIRFKVVKERFYHRWIDKFLKQSSIVQTIGFVTLELGFDEYGEVIIGDIDRNTVEPCARCGGASEDTGTTTN